MWYSMCPLESQELWKDEQGSWISIFDIKLLLSVHLKLQALETEGILDIIN